MEAEAAEPRFNSPPSVTTVAEAVVEAAPPGTVKRPLLRERSKEGFISRLLILASRFIASFAVGLEFKCSM